MWASLNAAWRALPASAKQLETLRNLYVVTRVGMTRGEASDAITRVLGNWD